MRACTLPLVPLVMLLFLTTIPVAVRTQEYCTCDRFTNRTALIDFFMAMQGPRWKNGYNANWGNASTTICEWPGLGCGATETHPNGEFLSMNFPTEAGLDGVLPRDLFMYLNNVLSVDISIANACNALPASLGYATQLTWLRLKGPWTGPVPESWGNLPLLMELTIDAYQQPICTLTSSLPASWSSMTVLQTLSLPSFNLTGPLPASWAAMTSLRELNLAYNMLSGLLPPSWASMTQLQDLKLNHNTLSGSVPYEWVNLMPLRTHLNNNAFNGTVPLNWKPLTEIVEATLLLQCNSFQGLLPTFAGFEYLIVNASHNQFSGEIPQNWYELMSSTSNEFFVDVSYNQLTGTPQLCTEAFGPYSTDQIELVLSHNQFSGMPNVSCYGRPDSCATVLDPNVLDGNNFCGVCSLPPCAGCPALAGYTIPQEFDLAILEGSELECCAACRNTTSCVAAVVAMYHNYQFCTLKNASEPLVPKRGHTVLLTSSSVSKESLLL